MTTPSRIDISIIIPCRNEEKCIGKCLDGIIANDYPKDRIEILVVDGMSEDGTLGVVEKYEQQYAFIKVLRNPKRIIPSAMNIGIRNARGDIIMKMDAHSTYDREYISKCERYLHEYDADNVGGIWKMVPRENTLLGNAIVFALSNPFGAGNAHFKTGSKEPRWVDTAPFGCYRKSVLHSIGLYDENIARSEDVAINSRLRRSGGRVLLVPDIVIHYYARSKFGEFCNHNFDNGFWITYPLKFGRLLFSWRHIVPLAFVAGLTGVGLLSFFFPFLWQLFLLIVASYLLVNLYFSSRISFREENTKYFLIMPAMFAALHIGYGLGSVWGLLKCAVSKRFWSSVYSSMTAFLREPVQDFRILPKSGKLNRKNRK